MNDTFWWRLVNLNPVLFRTAIVSVVSLLTMSGVLIAPGIPDALTAAVAALAAFVAAIWARDGVTPNGKVVVYQPDPVGSPASVLPGEATAESASDRAVLSAARAAPVG